MGTHKRIIITFLFVIGFIILLNGTSYAGTQKWNALNYDVTVNSDGSMDVVETWDIYISETNTLFKDFNIDYSKYSGISNVRVALVSNGFETSLTQIYEEQYHVDSGCYYGLQIDSSTYEIAWNVGLDSSSDTRTYKVYYTISDAVKIYNDCTELYWQFLGTDNTISGKNVTGTIKLPKAVSDIEKLRVWAHGDLNGEIERTSEDTVTFSWKTLDANTMLEVRVVTEENVYKECTNIYLSNVLSSILAEEQAWADAANAERTRSRITVAILIVVNVIILVFFIFKMQKNRKKAKEINEKYKYSENVNIKYYREIPNEENATPARALYMYSFKSDAVKIVTPANGGKIFAGTILDLSLRGVIRFEPVNSTDVRIYLTGKLEELPEEEALVLELIKKAIKAKKTSPKRKYIKVEGQEESNDSEYITTSELTSYARKHHEDVHARYALIESDVEDYYKELNYIDKKREKAHKELTKAFNSYLIAFIMFAMIIPLIAILPTLYIGLLMCCIVTYKVNAKFDILSEEGKLEQAEWKALKKYIQDYSLLKEKSAPDIVLWEKYLVYATTFGIAKKAVEQLQAVYPEMFAEDSEFSSTSIGYWNVVTNPNFGADGFESFGKSLESVYRSASAAYSSAHSSSSSGSGGGGGSSGGGGGRPEVAVAVVVDKPLC